MDYLLYFFLSFFLSKTLTDLKVGERIIATTTDPRLTGILQENVTILFIYNKVTS